MPLPDRAPETGIEDTENIDDDISSLANLYIRPIDKLRSISRPSVSPGASKSSDPSIPIVSSNFVNLQVDNFKPMESRTHAFYRSIGLPVFGSDGSFYNPGFDPISQITFTKRQSVNSKISGSLQTIINTRETNSDLLKQIFVNQDIVSSTYAILLRYPIPFKVLADGKKPTDVDSQTFTVDVRNGIGGAFALLNPLSIDEITSAVGTLNKAQHILRPFMVDPRIEDTVMPDNNKICVPFLFDKKSTQISSDVFLQRPCIEDIIRQRLSSTTQDQVFQDDLVLIFNGQVSTTNTTAGLDVNELNDIIESLSTNNSIDNATIDTFKGFTNIQVTTVSRLIKTIKAIIKKLNDAMSNIDEARIAINWVPVPSQDGPGTGAVGAALSRTGTNNSQSLLDLQIISLRAKKLNSERQIISQQDIGNFSSPFFGSSNPESIQTFDDQLNELTQKRDKLANNAFKAMGEIETITGEVSGLGLIDILSIYTALWAIDTETLINFLDQDAFLRMYNNNPSFQSIPEVSARHSGSQKSILDVLTTFEGKVSLILGFADKLLEDQLSSPAFTVSGSLE